MPTLGAVGAVLVLLNLGLLLCEAQNETTTASPTTTSPDLGCPGKKKQKTTCGGIQRCL
jgi:hypothetical protein